MANICWFEMRVRGTKENCQEMFDSDIPCYDAYIDEEQGTDEDYMMYIKGECRWSVYGSMVNVDEDETLAAKAKKFNIELEVCALDESEEVHERFHYKGNEVIKENWLPSYLPDWEIEENEMGLSEEDIAKYEKNEEHEIYVLKSELTENFRYDYDEDKPVFDFVMSFADLEN